MSDYKTKDSLKNDSEEKNKMVTEMTKLSLGSAKKSKKDSSYESSRRGGRRQKAERRSRCYEYSCSCSRSHSRTRSYSDASDYKHRHTSSCSCSISSSISRSRSRSSVSSRSNSSNRGRNKRYYRNDKRRHLKKRDDRSRNRKFKNRERRSHRGRHGQKKRDISSSGSSTGSSRPRRDYRRSGSTSRSRTRSPHPLLKGTIASAPVKVQTGNVGQKFWDGFHWVDKATNNQQQDPAILNQTKKMRRFVISNLPLQLGLNEKEIEQFVTKFIVENYLNEPNNFQHIREVTIDRSLNNATIELSSIEEASRLSKIDCIQILGHSCRISRVGDSKFGTTSTLGNLLTETQRTAQARAAAIKALDILQNKNDNISFQLSQLDLGTLITPQ